MTDLAIFHDFTPEQQEAACLVESLRFARDYKQAAAHNVCRDFCMPPVTSALTHDACCSIRREHVFYKGD